MATDVTTKILIEIRDGIRGTNERLDQTNERLDQTNERVTVLAKITQGIDTRLSRMESNSVFLPRRVDVLEQKVRDLELAIVPKDQ